MIKKHNCHSKEFKLMSRANRTLFLCQKHHHGWVGGLTAKGHIELMTDFQAGKIFDNLRTKEKGQVSLF